MRLTDLESCPECEEYPDLFDPTPRVQFQGWWYCYTHAIQALMQLGQSVLKSEE